MMRGAWRIDRRRRLGGLFVSAVAVAVGLGATSRADEEADGGVPWYVILDAAGKPLVTSNAPELRDEYNGNTGFPTSKDAIDHLMNMFKQTATNLSDAALAATRRSY